MKTFRKLDKEFTINKGSILCLEPIFLDTETSNNHAEDSHDLITWISSIQLLWGDEYHLFRKPESLIDFLNKVIRKYRLYKDSNLTPKIVIYIHNMNYDLSYLIPYLEQGITRYDGQGQGILEGLNKWVTYTVGPFEFRCTYRLSNRSLEKWGIALNIPKELRKKVGLYDYKKTVYQDSELSEDEQDYDKYDVISLQACWRKQCKIHGDTLATIPLTATGYPRRDLRNSLAQDEHFYEDTFLVSRLTPELYYAWVHSYAGGFTHNNRWYKDTLIQAGKPIRFMEKVVRVDGIGHRDFRSFYPSILRTMTFPLGEWKQWYDYKIGRRIEDLSEVLDLSPEYTTMNWIEFDFVKLKDNSISMPFLQECKLSYDPKHNTCYLADNGRIIYMGNNGNNHITMYVDNETLRVLLDQYEFHGRLLKSWRSYNKPLPSQIIKVIDEYFQGKSDKKNISKRFMELYGESDEKTLDAEAELQVVKALLNALYGVFAQNPVKDEYYMDSLCEYHNKKCYLDTDNDQVRRNKIHEHYGVELDKFYASRKNFIIYPIAGMVTSYARARLYEYVTAIGYEYVIYCDTDSAYYIKNEDNEKRVEALNDKYHATAPYVTLEDGSKVYYDCFDKEGDLKAFKGLHSKCYGYVNMKDELICVIAGVPARTLVGFEEGKPVYVTREDELRGSESDPIKALNKLENNLTFTINTGMKASYVGSHGKDTPKTPSIVIVDGHEISTAGGAVLTPPASKKIRPTEYDFTQEYEMYKEDL